MLACFGVDNTLEMFEIKSDEEAKLKMKKRLRKQRKKDAKYVVLLFTCAFILDSLSKFSIHFYYNALSSCSNAEGVGTDDNMPLDQEEGSNPTLRDEIVRLPVLKYGGKVKSSSLAVGRGRELRVSPPDAAQ